MMGSAARDAVGEFRRFAGREPLDLLEGALLVSRLIDPGADLDLARARIEELAARVADLRAAGETGIEALRRVLFDQEGFRGDTESYDEPLNCSVAHALSARRGMPVTLCVVTVEVGRRAGLALQGVGLPGHFVVSGAELPEGQYLDPFDGGALCDAEALGRRVGVILGSPVELTPEAFEPDPPRAVLWRILANLRRSCEKRGRFEEALAALDCAEVLDPDQASLWRERGLLLLKTGRSAEAVQALEAYVESAAGDDTEAMKKLIAIVREQALPAVGAELVRPEKRIFTLGEARSLLPRIRERTSDAVFRYARLGQGGEDTEQERQTILHDWAREMQALGVEIKGPWLVDFDSGAGYYCWKYPEASLEYFHGYDEGFAGRLPLQ